MIAYRKSRSSCQTELLYPSYRIQGRLPLLSHDTAIPSSSLNPGETRPFEACRSAHPAVDAWSGANQSLDDILIVCLAAQLIRRYRMAPYRHITPTNNNEMDNGANSLAQGKRFTRRGAMAIKAKTSTAHLMDPSC
jgi:hypothetical protein